MATIRKNKTKKGISYKIIVSEGLDVYGKQIRHYKTYIPPHNLTEAKADKEAQKVAMRFEEDLKSGYAPDSKLTFAEYADYVLDLKHQEGLKPSTEERYRSLLERINLAIGHMKLVDIRPKHLNMLYANLRERNIRTPQAEAVTMVDLREMLREHGLSMSEASRQAGIAHSTLRNACDGKKVTFQKAECIAKVLGHSTEELFEIQSDTEPLSPKTVLEHHRLIRAILAVAEKEMIVKYNAASHASPPKAETPDRGTLELEEVTRILAALDVEPLLWNALVHVLIVTGARRGEIMGLRWGKVDLEHRTIQIDETLLSLKSGVQTSTPKTKRSRRQISIPAESAELLQELKNASLHKDDDDFVFCRTDGKPLHPDSLNQWLRKFSKRHDLPPLYPHLFRHTQASLLIHNGTDILTVSQRLGHATSSTTLNFYGHAVKEADARAADCVADLLLK